MARLASSISLALVFAVAVSWGSTGPAHAAPKLPKGDKFWTVSDYTGSLYGWNPGTKSFQGQTIDGPEGGTVQDSIIGGGWDHKNSRFVLVDGWGSGTANQGLLVYNTKSTSWSRYAIDMGEGNSYGFQIRDVAANGKGKLFLLVKNSTDADPGFSHYIVPVTQLNSDTNVATAGWISRVQIRNEFVSYASLSFDPRSNGRIYLQSLDYAIDLIAGSSGALLSTSQVEPSYDQLVHFDIDSNRRYWAYGGNGAELLYGALDNGRSNVNLGVTDFSSTLNCLIIQRKAR